ncbi:LCP family protein [Actinopolymorpha sp. NPDC004070]|uniref:LCP family protein n=1 Tax=Actinopolymorpha sp. NPDC004070 TaxID=3154548 RepID=UPI0033A337E6
MTTRRTKVDDTLRTTRHRHETSRRAHRSVSRRVGVGLLILLSTALFIVGGLALATLHNFQKFDRIQRFPALREIPEAERPKKPTGDSAADAVNVLIAGSDARTHGVRTTGEGKGDAWKRRRQRADTLMLLHITSDRKSVQVISFPRDSWVTIPGHGKNRLNAAYSFGGPQLYVRTMEHLTGLRIDHVAAIDWAGFMALTDALGGVEMSFKHDTRLTTGKQYAPGTHTLSGEEALAYVRERHHVPGGDFGRIDRQQNFLRTLMGKVLSSGTLTHPIMLDRMLTAISQNLSVDDEFTSDEIRSLAIEMRNLHAGNVTFMTAPTKGYGTEGSRSVVYLDKANLSTLMSAISSDDLQEWLRTHGKNDVLGRDVR